MGLYEDGKAVIDFIQQSDNVDLLQKMLSIQKQSLDLQGENAELKKKITFLEANSKLREALIFEDNAYWKKEDEGNRTGPFCSPCLDSKEKLIRLQKDSDGYGGSFYCPVCENCP